MSAQAASTELEPAWRAYREGRHAQCRRECEAHLAAYPGDARAHYLLGLATLKGDDDLRGAAIAFRNAGRADPREYSAIQNAVSCLAEAVRRGEAPFPVLPSIPPSASPKPLSIAVCSIDPARLARMQQNFAEHLAGREHEFVVIGDARSLAEGYTRALARCRHDTIVFTHDDVELLTPQPFDALEQALGRSDIVGLAGTRLVTGPAVIWAGHPHIHGWVSYPARAGETGYDAAPLSLVSGLLEGMQALDGLFFATRREVVEKVGFDATTFDGFHYYDLDFTLRAHRAGLRLAVTTDVIAIHASLGHFGEDWNRYRQCFIEKFPELSAPKGDHHAYGARLADRAQLLTFHEQLRGLEAAP